jgi:hypothetical protein
MFRKAQEAIPDSELPGTFNSFATALLPVVLLGALTLSPWPARNWRSRWPFSPTRWS